MFTFRPFVPPVFSPNSYTTYCTTANHYCPSYSHTHMHLISLIPSIHTSYLPTVLFYFFESRAAATIYRAYKYLTRYKFPFFVHGLLFLLVFVADISILILSFIAPLTPLCVQSRSSLVALSSSFWGTVMCYRDVGVCYRDVGENRCTKSLKNAAGKPFL
jgi:hypothetical protein